jgi:hypothetical protein
MLAPDVSPGLRWSKITRPKGATSFSDNFPALRSLLVIRAPPCRRSRRFGDTWSNQPYSIFSIAQMSPPCGRKRSKSTHFPSGDQTG